MQIASVRQSSAAARLGSGAVASQVRPIVDRRTTELEPIEVAAGSQ
jgi:hypothetical protein